MTHSHAPEPPDGASRFELLGRTARGRLGRLGEAVELRLRLLRDAAPPDHASAPPMSLFLAELREIAEPVLRQLRPPLPIEPAARPQVVILLPGFATGPSRMRYMARQLERAGHTVKQWGIGFNLGPTPENFAALGQRVCAVQARYGRQVVLVGWSLGGIFAREVAKRHPDCVAKVITLGSPFSHTPYSNNMWRAYTLVAGHSVEHLPIEAQVHEKPPVETIAMWSPRDGVIAPRAAAGLPGERDKVVALRCSHLGFCNSPEAILAVVRELAR